MADLKIFADSIEEEAKKQIEAFVAMDAFKDAKVRVMPDCHSGTGCTIGFTANLGDKVIPNVVGVDIGCGVRVDHIGMAEDIDLQDLDSVIHKNIPAGHNLHEAAIENHLDLINGLRCIREISNNTWGAEK